MTSRVRDLMHWGIITCRPDATLGQVAVMITQHRIHALFVADRQNRVTGLVTDFDLLTGEWLSTDEESLSAMRAMTAGELMSTPPATIHADTPISEAARLMKDNNYKRLLVIQNGQNVGVLSLSDLIARLAARTAIHRNKVADVMSRVMLVCRKEATVVDVARGMTISGYRSVLVVDSNGRPVGVVSGLDILEVQDDQRHDATAEDVMHPALTIQQTASLREAADEMIENYHHRLIVVDPQDPHAMPVGIISSVDIVAEMAQPGSVWQKA